MASEDPVQPALRGIRERRRRRALPFSGRVPCSLPDADFRLNEVFRFREIQMKSEALLSVTEVFTTLSHARRSTRLEYVVIALIAIEVVIYVADLVFRGH